jgi:mono/diheme cytochrome c family protein
MRAPVLSVLVIGALALAGCGSSSGPEASAPASASADGRHLFTTVGCSSCHTLADAGAAGHVGPDLDRVKPSAAAVARQVSTGGGAMPSFKGALSEPQIQAVASYVARVAGH